MGALIELTDGLLRAGRVPQTLEQASQALELLGKGRSMRRTTCSPRSTQALGETKPRSGATARPLDLANRIEYQREQARAPAAVADLTAGAGARPEARG